MKRYFHQFNAMASPCSFHLIGEDTDHLARVSLMLEEEVRQYEDSFSAYAVTAELHRLNQLAPSTPKKISVDLFEILSKSIQYYEWTKGYFDIGWKRNLQGIPLNKRLTLDRDHHSICYIDPSLVLDLGGVGKGEILDRLTEMLEYYQISSYLLNAGNSSVLAKGKKEDGSLWNMELKGHKQRFNLQDTAMSTSAGGCLPDKQQGIYDPITSTGVNTKQICMVFGPSSGLCEVLSTSLIAMGKERAFTFFSSSITETYQAIWREKGRSECLALKQKESKDDGEKKFFAA